MLTLSMLRRAGIGEVMWACRSVLLATRAGPAAQVVESLTTRLPVGSVGIGRPRRSGAVQGPRLGVSDHVLEDLAGVIGPRTIGRRVELQSADVHRVLAALTEQEDRVDRCEKSHVSSNLESLRRIIAVRAVRW